MTTDAQRRARREEHPAKFSKSILEAAGFLLEPLIGTDKDPALLLDFFGGVGLIHDLDRPGLRTVACELQYRWAWAHPRTVNGNSTQLPFADDTFDGVFSSPTYANRMADTYDGSRDRCVPCKKRMKAGELTDPDVDCELCGGTGFAPSSRTTYTIAHGGPLHRSNTGRMQWGAEYRAVEIEVFREVARVLKPGRPAFINVSNSLQEGEEITVVEWHLTTLFDLGYKLVQAMPVNTPRHRHGANWDLRVDNEFILVLTAPDAPPPARLFY